MTNVEESPALLFRGVTYAALMALPFWAAFIALLVVML